MIARPGRPRRLDTILTERNPALVELAKRAKRFRRVS